MKTIWLVRHGETLFNIEEKLQGMSDSPLTESGLKQIELVSNFLASRPIEAIFSSDLLRAEFTANRIASRHAHIPVITNSKLRERSFGIYEGKPYTEYRAYAAERHKELDFSVPEGESLLEVCSRAQNALDHINTHDFKECVVVAHGSFNRCFLGVASGCPSHEWIEFKQRNCCVNQLIQNSDGLFRIEILNHSEHLDFR
jgi:broad specificity phosphatase PhoE